MRLFVSYVSQFQQDGSTKEETTGANRDTLGVTCTNMLHLSHRGESPKGGAESRGRLSIFKEVVRQAQAGHAVVCFLCFARQGRRICDRGRNREARAPKSMALIAGTC